MSSARSANLIYKFTFVFLTSILFFFSYFPVYQNFMATPKDRFYFGASDYPLDMMGNLASVYEGYLGRWERDSKATSTIYSEPTLMKFEYILIGQLARALKSDHIIIFLLTRLLISIVFVWFLGFVLLPFIFKKTSLRIVAVILVLFSTGILPAINDSSLRILLTFPSELMVFQRLTLSAHHYILGSLFSILALYHLAKTIDGKKTTSLIFASIFGFLGTYVFFPAVLLIYLSLPFFLFFRLFKYPYKAYQNDYKRILFVLIIFLIFSALPFIYLSYVSRFFEFNTFAGTEKIAPFDLKVSNYIIVVGLSFVFSLFSLKKILREGSAILYFFLSYLFIHPASVFIIDHFVSLNKIRFFYTSYFIVFGVLATIGIGEIAHILRKRIFRIPNIIIYGLFTFLILYPSIHNLKMSYDRNFACFCQKEFFDYGYPKKEVITSINYLKKNSKEEDVVLTGYFAGVLIPAFSGNRVYASWWLKLMQTENINEVEGNINRFYSGEMTSAEAFNFVKKENISYVFFGQEERRKFKGKRDLIYSFLEAKHRDAMTILYKVGESI